MNSFFNLFKGRLPAKKTLEDISLEIRDLLKAPMEYSDEDYNGRRTMAIYDAYVMDSVGDGKIITVIWVTEKVMSYKYKIIRGYADMYHEMVLISFEFPGGTQSCQSSKYITKHYAEKIPGNECMDYRDIYRDSKARVLEALQGFLTELQLSQWNITDLENVLIDLRRIFA